MPTVSNPSDPTADTTGETSAPRVGVVILNWNGWSYTKDAIASVRGQTYPNLVCVVADNGSAESEIVALRTAANDTDILLLENGANLGFSGGNNRGAEAARNAGAELLLFLNNDATLAPDTVARLVEALSLPDVGAASPCIYHALGNRDVWFGFGTMHLDHPALVTIGAYRLPADENGIAPTHWACGCVFLIPTELYFTLGGFDEGLFAYHEDVDLSLKVRAAGKRCVMVPEASAWHVGGGGSVGMSPRQLYYTTRNAMTVVERHGNAAEKIAFHPRFAKRVRLLSLSLLLRTGADDEIIARAAALRLGFADGQAKITGAFENRSVEYAAMRVRCTRQRWLLRTMGQMIPPPLQARLDARTATAIGLS